MNSNALQNLRNEMLVNITENLIYLRSEDKLDFKFDNPLKCLPAKIDQTETTTEHINLRSLFINGDNEDSGNLWYTDMSKDANKVETLSTESIEIINDTLQEITDEKQRICKFIFDAYVLNHIKPNGVVGGLVLKEPLKLQHINMFLTIIEIKFDNDYNVCVKSDNGLGDIDMCNLSLHNLELIENHLKSLYC